MFAWIKDNLQMIFLVCGIIVGTWLIWKFRALAGQGELWKSLLTGICFTVCSFGAALAFACIEMVLAGDPVSVGAVSTYGVYLIAAPVVLICVKLLRRNTNGYMDLFALYVIPSLFLMRVNCLIGGCCGGKSIFHTQWHWPTRETELIFFVIMFLVLLRLARKNENPGQLFPVLMMSYGCFRFINEWFRTGDELVLGLHVSHIWSILCAVIGLSIWFELKVRADRKAQRKTNRRN